MSDTSNRTTQKLKCNWIIAIYTALVVSIILFMMIWEVLR